MKPPALATGYLKFRCPGARCWCFPSCCPARCCRASRKSWRWGVITTWWPVMNELHDRALGAYLGFAIGDALGATVEFMRPREIAARYGVHRDIIGGGWLKLARGQVTDDTTMSLALGEALLTGGTDVLARHAQGDATLVRLIGDAYVRWFRRKPVDCGNTCRRGIMRYMHEGSLEGAYNPGDGGNGALMRNLPAVLATLGDDAAFERLSIAQSHLTHHHPLSDAATLGLGRLLTLLLGGMGHSACQRWV